MADNPTLRGLQDGHLVSWQSHEISYVLDKLRAEFRGRTRVEVLDAVTACKRSIQPSEGRDKLMACARSRLR